MCRPLPPRLDRGRKAEEEGMQEVVGGQVAVDASSVGRRLAVLSDGNYFKICHLFVEFS